MNVSLDRLPRLLELHTRFSSSAKNNFFHEFPDRLAGDSGVTFSYYSKIEKWLNYVPSTDWEAYCLKIKVTVTTVDRYRHWQALHDVFNESLGAKILSTRYRCKNIRLIETQIKKGQQSKAPDWVGSSLSKTTFVEVKTLNHSQLERESWYSEDQLEHQAETQLKHQTAIPPELETKIKKVYEEAIEQLRAVGCAKNRRVVLMIFNRDYNLDPIDESIESVVLNCLTKMERQEFPILCRIQGP